MDANRQRLRALVREPGGPVAVFRAHDPVERVAMRAWSGRGEKRLAAAA